MSSQRQIRYGELIRSIISDCLLKEDFYDPGFKPYSITRWRGITENSIKDGSRNNRNLFSGTTAIIIHNEKNELKMKIQFILIYLDFWSKARNENIIPNGSKINK